MVFTLKEQMDTCIKDQLKKMSNTLRKTKNFEFQQQYSEFETMLDRARQAGLDVTTYENKGKKLNIRYWGK